MTPTRLDLGELSDRIATIPDPEIPVVTIADLGILRSVEIDEGVVVVTITPTYSGCPAMHHIEAAIVEIVKEEGVDVQVRTVFNPAWTTDWIAAEAREKLRVYGVAPPRLVETPISLSPRSVACPCCGSSNTELISQFGSTACKSLRKCLDCLEPFDHFKEF